MRKRIPLNNDWLFTEGFEAQYVQTGYDDSSWIAARIPHNVKDLPYNNFDEKDYQMISCYRRSVSGLELKERQRLFLHFHGVMAYCEVYWNGAMVGFHKGGYTPFKLEITRELLEDVNQIVVMVDSTERPDIPPFGYVIDYLTYGGIYREVELEIVSDTFLDEVKVIPQKALSDSPVLNVSALLNGFVSINNLSSTDNLNIQANLTFNQEPVRSWDVKINDVIDKDHYFELELSCPKVHLWDVDEANLYELQISLYEENQLIDQKTIRTGFREAVFRRDGFFLNGKPMKIRGLNRHQSYPYVGYAMPKRAQIKDADILKYDLGLNAVRLSHYPQSDHFMDRCDEIGLLVFDEIPGWQHIGDEEWQEVAVDNVREMILKDVNHPSVIIWGVRINESADHDLFYMKTNAMARSVDSSRQTGGVRCITNSSLLEDVYTYNDFSHTGNNPGVARKKQITKTNKPYLITEYNGHMYPTKKFDDEQHRIYHVRRHLQVVHDINKDPLISGGFGWCMFDYNTHKDFGSGDKICYHGVMDMFRIPKHAAYVYASQQGEKPVLHIASSMQIGEFEGSLMKDVLVLTNCDYVELYKNGKFVTRFYPDSKTYPYLEHPPILIDDFIGEGIREKAMFKERDGAFIKRLLIHVSQNGEDIPLGDKLRLIYLFAKYRMTRLDVEYLYAEFFGGWGGEAVEYELKGFVNNECAVSSKRGQVTKPELVVEADDYALHEGDTYDVIRVVIRIQDDYGQDLYYANDPVQIEAEGAIEIIGPKILPLIGGSIGLWVKTKGVHGSGKLTVYSERFGKKTLDFEVMLKDEK